MPIRSFTLNSPEIYEAACRPSERPWIPNGALPRGARRPDRSEGVSVVAETHDAAEGAFGAWLAHIDAGRLG